MARGEVEARARASFEIYLEDLGDVMQLYYGGTINWAEAMQQIGFCAETLRKQLTEEIAELARGPAR